MILPMGVFAEVYPEVGVVVNGTPINSDQPAIIYQDRTLVPLRAICEALDFEVSWNDESKTAVIENSDFSVSVVIDSVEISKKTISDGKTETITIDVPAKIFNGRTLVPLRAISEAFGMEVIWNSEEKCVYIEGAQEINELKVLAIGNSFSTDGMQWIYQIAEDYGIENITLGNMSIGSCSLEKHWSMAESGEGAYNYYKNTDGTWQINENSKLADGINDEQWDVIAIQQVSGDSGIADTYEPYLGNLINYIKETCENKDVKIVWHMTWAYDEDSDREAFAKYDNNQEKMYEMITETAKTKVVPYDEIEYVIPSGTAIQNARGRLDKTLTRDGFHLSYNLGRYIAGLTWFHQITGLPIDDITYVPDKDEITEEDLKIIKECVKDAVKIPFEVTKLN